MFSWQDTRRKLVESKHHRWLLPAVLLWLSLVLLRLQVALFMGLSADEAVAARIVAGFLRDLSIVLWPQAIVVLLWVGFAVPMVWSWPAVAFVVWLCSLANVIYFRFFELRLDWWIVKVHWRDLGQVKGSAVELGDTRLIWGSMLFLAAAVLLSVFFARHRKDGWPYPTSEELPGRWRERMRPVLWMVAVVTLSLWVPKWIGQNPSSTILNDTVLRWWWRQATEASGVMRTTNPDWERDLMEMAQGMDLAQARKTLLTYRGLPNGADADFADGDLSVEPLPPAATGDSLQWRVQTDAAVTQALRARLGLPAQGPVNVILLFLESVRAFEIQDAEIGPLLFPRLRRVLDVNSLHFTQAYSSALNAGQTVRAQFSTQCSHLPNIGGAATYIAHTNLRIRCVQSLFGEAGYRTVWANSYQADFHRKRTFEMLHGMQEFYDETYYEAQGITHRIGDWGLADGPFLEATLRLLETLSAQGQPLYANVLTISTHHPFSEIAEGPVPQPLRDKYGDDHEYLGYLSRLAYLDTALGDFFERYFESPLAERTLLVLLGDHGVPAMPEKGLQPYRWSDIRFRVPLALITKGQARPQKIARPVHQIDIVPTALRVAGVGGEVTWLGRGLFAPEASPWLWEINGAVSYRVDGTACYARWKSDPMRCYDVRGKDPLVAAELPEVPENPETTRFFREVIRANLGLIGLNGILPR